MTAHLNILVLRNEVLLHRDSHRIRLCSGATRAHSSAFTSVMVCFLLRHHVQLQKCTCTGVCACVYVLQLFCMSVHAKICL